MKKPIGPFRPGVTLVELLVVIAVISFLGSVAYVNYQNTAATSRETKLESDVATLNRAVQLYRNSGGSFTGEESEEEVLRKLKTTASRQSASTIAGPSGSFIDRRITLEWQSAAEADGSGLRARWDATAERFVTTREGAAGVRQFLLDESLGEQDFGTENRTASLPLAQQTQWIWDYENAEPTTISRNATAPETDAVNRLLPPTFSPAGGALPLASFQPTIGVTLTNPNPGGSSEIFYSVGGGPFIAYGGGPIPVGPGQRILAYSASKDTARWLNSTVRETSFTVVPHQLTVSINGAPSSMTFAQAGGSMVGQPITQPAPLTVTVNTAGIHPSFISSANFQIATALQNATLSTAGSPAFSGNFTSPQIPISYTDWGASNQLNIRAQAVSSSPYFISSPIAEAAIAINPTVLDPPTVSPEAPFMLPNFMEMALSGVVPTGARIFYRLDGGEPLNAFGAPVPQAQLYITGFNPNILVEFSVKAATAGPAGFEHWFAPALFVANYVIPTGADADTVGAIVGSGNIDGAFYGSLIFANPSGTVNFNSQGRILGGNLFLPGLPAINIQPSPGTVALAGQPYVAGATIPRNVIGGKEYTETGALANPQVDLRQIVDLAGDPNPSNYLFRFNANSYLDGKVFRRANPPVFPTVTLPTGLPSRGSIDLKSNSNPPTVTLLGGDYSSISIGADNNIIYVGVAGATEPTEYIFRNVNLNKGRIVPLGPVKISFPNGFNVSSAVFGDVNQPELLRIEVINGSVNVNSGGTLSARLTAPNSTVSLNGIFRGTLIATELKVNGNGVAFTLPPIIEGI